MCNQLTAILSSGLLLVATGCPSSDPPPGPLTIGVRSGTGVFQPLADKDVVPVVLGANGLNMIVPSLRTVEADPRAPDPTVLVRIGDIVIGADIEGSPTNMQPDGDGHVLWDLRVPFQSELCCYNCAEAKVSAKIVDFGGRTFEGNIGVSLQRGQCPDPAVCCASANDCPDPALTQLCQ